MSGTDFSGLDTSMMDLFVMELEQHSQALETGLVAAEELQDAKAVEPLMRAAHSVKGAARIMGIGVVADMAHVMEDLLVAVQDGKRVLDEALADQLLAANDLLRRMAKVPEQEMVTYLGEQEEALEAMTQQLRGVGEKKQAVVAPPVVEEPLVQEEPVVVEEAVVREEAKASSQPKDQRVVRVQAESLNRLMGLAGEFLVESRWMGRFCDALQLIKNTQREAGSLMEKSMELQAEGQSEEEICKMMADARTRLDGAQEQILQHIDQVEQYVRRQEQLSDRLYNEVIVSRMRPFSDGLHGFPRMVRDVAKQLGKQVELMIQGAATPVDRDIQDRLEAPLNHLLRNAVDHGLECPEERQAAGKPPKGRILLEAQHRAGMLHITVQDDGHGVDLERLRAKAIDRGHVTEAMAADLSEHELLQFLFLPGFSTAGKVTDISGRGVGLDVVHAAMREVGGSVNVVSEWGQGTAFHLELPLTLSVLRTLVVRVGGEQFAFPLSRIDRIQEVADGQLATLEDRLYYVEEGEQIALVPAGQILGVQPEKKSPGALHQVVLISDSMARYAVEVDAFVGQRELVVLPLDRRLGKVQNISAGAIREDGSPLLIVDVEDLVRSIDRLVLHGKPQVRREVRLEEQREVRRILVVDDSLTVREVERKLLAAHGYDVTTAVDGMDGWNVLQRETFDLVLTDVDMPRMNGIELVRKIRQVHAYAELPVMIVSYKDREEDRLAGLDAGANYYLTKSSFHDDVLIQAVVDLIGKA